MRLDVSFEVRDAVVVAVMPRARQHLDVSEFQTGLLLERQHRALVHVFEGLLDIVLLKHVVAGLVVDVGLR
jgi:hypothetical protein